MSNELSKLVMEKDTLLDLPELHCPPGYVIRTFEKGDESSWEYIIRHSFNREISFGKKIGNHPAFQPDRVFFICSESIPVATATAWEISPASQDCGYLHMVGALPEHSGKGLGYTASFVALYKMRENHKEKVVLETDDFRLAAIRIYLKLGFHPVHMDEEQPARWGHIFSQLNQV